MRLIPTKRDALVLIINNIFVMNNKNHAIFKETGSTDGGRQHFNNRL